MNEIENFSEFMQLPNWGRCPSTHCERRQECCTPGECSGTGAGPLKRARQRLGLSQNELAKKVGSTGRTIRRYEAKELPIPLMYKLAVSHLVDRAVSSALGEK